MPISMTVTNAGLNLLRDAMSGNNNALITYVGLGTGTTSPTVSDTQLGTEVFRKAVTSYSNGTNAGEILINMYLASTDAQNVAITEVGFFGGTSASTQFNTGVLLARALWSHTHTNTESIQFQLDFTI